MTKAHKRILWILSLILFFTFGLKTERANAQYDAYVSYNDFYQNLAPYGQWIEDGQYGYVWSPNESGNFRPYYSEGHWVMTEYGNTWVSDYPWGWACFHYGRWTYDTYYGWLWIPGQDWGPAWVSWRSGDGYYGWAPLGPGYTDFGTDYSCPNDWWVFIPPQYIYGGNYYHYWYGPRGNSKILHNTNFINHTYENNHVTYVSGPRSTDVESITHQPVQVYHLANSKNLNTRTTTNNVVKMYRPAQIMPAASIGGQKVTPPNVVAAPQPVRSTPQAINTTQAATPEFRNNVPRNNGQTQTVGTNFTEIAKPAPQQQRNNNPYEYDVNRPVQQPTQTRQEYTAPAQNSRPEPQQTRQVQQQPQPQQNNNPQPQRQQSMPAPQPSRQAPAPQPARSEAGGRR